MKRIVNCSSRLPKPQIQDWAVSISYPRNGGREYNRRRYRLIAAHLDERMRRLVAAAEAAALGFGGTSIVARARECRGEPFASGQENSSKSRVS